MADNIVSIPPAGKTAESGKRTVFTGLVKCPLFSGQAKLTLRKDCLLISTKFDQLTLPYGEITAFALVGYQVDIQTRNGVASISCMGQATQWFYDKLYAVYNDAVLEALLVDGRRDFETAGGYIADENGKTRTGQAVIRLYEDCLCILPPDEHARRIPLCFLSNMENDGFSMILTLATGERYTLSKLGRELDNLERLLTDSLRALRERTLQWHRELTPNISSMQAAMAAKLMPLGTAAYMEKLTSAAPLLAAALEEKIKDSRMAQTYPWLRDLCGGYGLAVGALPPPRKEGVQPAMPVMSTTENTISRAGQKQDEKTEPLPILWAIAPDRSRKLVAVELALGDDEAAATYLYRVEGEWETFALLIDRALEASGCQRELILMPDEELNAADHLEAAMLVKRTLALLLMRRCFVGRAIHSSPDRWCRDIEKYCAAISPDAASKQEERHCTRCGATLALDAKFCGQCGSQQ